MYMTVSIFIVGTKHLREFANPTPHVVKAANTIGEAINDRIESMFGMLDR
jgi:hypothetical protein